jgi:hypothetical protein
MSIILASQEAEIRRITAQVIQKPAQANYLKNT